MKSLDKILTDREQAVLLRLRDDAVRADYGLPSPETAEAFNVLHKLVRLLVPEE